VHLTTLANVAMCMELTCFNGTPFVILCDASVNLKLATDLTRTLWRTSGCTLFYNYLEELVVGICLKTFLSYFEYAEK